MDAPEFVLVPGGEFVMGKAGSRRDEEPAHSVVLDAFRAAVSPVTNAQYADYVLAAGAAQPPFLAEAAFAPGDQPVVGISWYDASDYCEWLTEKSGRSCRLPTEAEREYAALGGLRGGDWPWPDQHPLRAMIDALERPHVPQAGCGNGYGLLCMADNVHEWCLDWYSPQYYVQSPRHAPRGPANGTRRVSRGGSWRHKEKVTRVNARSSLPPGFRYSDFGFRVYADR